MKIKCIYILLLFFMCILSSFSQVLLKKAAGKEYNSFFRQYFNFFVITGYFIYVVVLFVNIYILKFVPLSLLSSISESLPLLLSFVCGRIFFNEHITKQKVIGGCFILCGIILLIL